MRVQFICYKTIFVNIDLRNKLTKGLIKLLYKKKKKIQADQLNPTQPNTRPNDLSFIGLEEIVDYIE